MLKNKFWQLATLLVSSYMVMAILPEVRLLGLIVLSLGLDTLILLIACQLVALFGAIYHQQLAPLCKSVNASLEKYDPLFFIPSRQHLKKFPQMAAHSVPFMLTGFVFLFSSEGVSG